MSKARKNIFTILLVICMFLINNIFVSAATDVAVFEDLSLYEYFKNGYGKLVINYDDETKSITMDQSSFLNVKILNISDKNISSLKGLEKFTNLVHLYANNNNIGDIQPLRDLKNLQYLLLEDNNIKDITSLKYLSNLTELQLPNNKITDASPLASLIKLNRVFLSGNYINDISFLDNLDNLTMQLLRDNVTSISLGEISQNSLKKVSLPNMFIYAKKTGSKVYTKDGLNLINCSLVGDEVTLDTTKLGNITASVTVVNGNAANSTYKINYTVISNPNIHIEDLIPKVSYSTLKNTTDSVTVTITVNKQIKGIEGWNLSSDKLKLTKTYKENTNESISIVDIDGIKKNVQIIIKNIVSNVPNNQLLDEANDEKKVTDNTPKEEIRKDNTITKNDNNDKSKNDNNVDNNNIENNNKYNEDNLVTQKNIKVIIISSTIILVIGCGLFYVNKRSF